MAHSLEVRVPYLDRTVVEHVQRLDASFKNSKRHGKWLHRQVCNQFLHPRILKRKKRGFAVNVVDGWFHSSVTGKLPEMLSNKDSLMYEVLRPTAVTAAIRRSPIGPAGQPQTFVQPCNVRAMVAWDSVTSDR